jgi:hypothetical protein
MGEVIQFPINEGAPSVILVKVPSKFECTHGDLNVLFPCRIRIDLPMMLAHRKNRRTIIDEICELKATLGLSNVKTVLSRVFICRGLIGENTALELCCPRPILVIRTSVRAPTP